MKYKNKINIDLCYYLQQLKLIIVHYEPKNEFIFQRYNIVIKPVRTSKKNSEYFTIKKIIKSISCKCYL